MSKRSNNPFNRHPDPATESTASLASSARRDVEEMFRTSRQSLDRASNMSDQSAPPSPDFRSHALSGPSGYTSLNRGGNGGLDLGVDFNLDRNSVSASSSPHLEPHPLQSNPGYYSDSMTTIGQHRTNQSSRQLDNQPYDPPSSLSMYQPPPPPSSSSSLSSSASPSPSPESRHQRQHHHIPRKPSPYQPYRADQSQSFEETRYPSNSQPITSSDTRIIQPTPGQQDQQPSTQQPVAGGGFAHTVTVVISSDGSGIITHSSQVGNNSTSNTTSTTTPSIFLPAPSSHHTQEDMTTSTPPPPPSPPPRHSQHQIQDTSIPNSSETQSLVPPSNEKPPVPTGGVKQGCPFRGPPTALSSSYKRLLLILVTTAGFFGPLAGTIYLPALPILAEDFGVGTTKIDASVSVFMLGFAFFPLFWATYADWKGRRPLYLASLAVYILANVLLAVVPTNYAGLMVLRIVQSFGSSAVVSMGAGTIADVFDPKTRGKTMSIFLLGPQFGPILGPLIGGILAGQAHWRWTFGFLAISATVLWFVILFFMPETLRSRVGNHSMYPKTPRPFFPPRIALPMAPFEDRGPPPPKPRLATYWGLVKYIPILVVSINTALLYATYFSITVIFPTHLSSAPYNWSITAIGAALVPSGLFLILGSLLGGRFSDYRRRTSIAALKLKAAAESDNGVIVDESTIKVPAEARLIHQTWGLLIYCLGVVAYGWFVHYDLHISGIIIATCLVGFGNSWVFVISTTFLTEIAPRQAAVAFALGNMLRNPAAALAAVLVSPVTTRIGTGWAFTGLALFNFFFVGYGILVLRMGTFRNKPGPPPGSPGGPPKK